MTVPQAAVSWGRSQEALLNLAYPCCCFLHHFQTKATMVGVGEKAAAAAGLCGTGVGSAETETETAAAVGTVVLMMAVAVAVVAFVEAAETPASAAVFAAAETVAAQRFEQRRPRGALLR